MTRQTQSQKAQAAVEDARRRLEELEAEKVAVGQELASLQGRAGEELLDDPAAGQRLTSEIRDLRDRAELLGRAVEAQRPRVRVAEVAFLTAEADRLDKIADKERAALAAHEQRTSELLAMLEEHEGRFVPEVELIEERQRHVITLDGEVSEWAGLKSDALRQAVELAEGPVEVLRAMVDGRAPEGVPYERYPACVWGPEAVVPASGYLRVVDQRRDVLREAEEAIGAAEERVDALEAELEEAKAAGEQRELRVVDPMEGSTVATRLQVAREKLEKARRRRGELEREVADLTGVPAVPEDRGEEVVEPAKSA